jgi:hypothetical protein
MAFQSGQPSIGGMEGHAIIVGDHDADGVAVQLDNVAFPPEHNQLLSFAAPDAGTGKARINAALRLLPSALSPGNVTVSIVGSDGAFR